MQQIQAWVAVALIFGLAPVPAWATEWESSLGPAYPRVCLADALSKELVKKVRKDFDIVLVEIDERDFPEAIEFIDRAASSVEANRKYLGTEEEYARLTTLVAQAREAIKQKQFLPSRRAVVEILTMLGRLQASVPGGVA